jgi:hypothetical protein
MMHALIYCSHAQRFWMEARRGLDLKLPELHPSTWTRDILCDQIISEKDRPKIITVMWAICVGIHPRIDYIKLDEHTQRLLLSPSVHIARFKLFLYFSSFSPGVAVLQTLNYRCLYRCSRPTLT